MYTHTNGLLRNRQEHASLVALDQKKASHATVYPSVFVSYAGADLRASATAPSPREANRTALRTLRTPFPSPLPPPSSPPPRLALFEEEFSSFLISARFALFSASTVLSAGSN